MIAERLRAMVASGCGLETPEGVQDVTVSFGVAQLISGESLDDIIARADGALRQAKDNGRNRVECSG